MGIEGCVLGIRLMREVIIIVIISMAQRDHSLWLGAQLSDGACIWHTEGQHEEWEGEEEEQREEETCFLQAPWMLHGNADKQTGHLGALSISTLFLSQSCHGAGMGAWYASQKIMAKPGV